MTGIDRLIKIKLEQYQADPVFRDLVVQEVL
jgi:hypothetical protein